MPADKVDPKKRIADLRAKLREAERLTRGGDAYARKREAMADRSREQSETGRDIGPLPPVKDPARRAACEHDLDLFARTYFPARYYLPSSEPQKRDRRTVQRCILNGGRFANARPRGGGKSTDAEVAVIWALVYGHRSFVVLFSATEDHAARCLKKITADLETNDRLLEDFPEVCHPIRSLDDIHQKTKGQILDGKPTRIEWTAKGITLPTIDGSKASGSVIRVVGLTASFRGMSILGPTGEPIRPDFVIVDDAQTRESAKSPTQTNDREAIVTDDVLGLAGPTVEIAAVMLCTVIYKGDLSDRFLDPDRHPEWQGSRSRLLERWPDAMERWDEYAELRRDSFRAGDEGKQATAFYIEHRAEMDAGADVPWPDRMKDGEVSALQSAMNLYFDNPRGFFAEYQNDPKLADPVEGAKQFNTEAVARRVSGLDRLVVPVECDRLTAFIDTGASVLWYAVVAWNDRGGGSVIDYGAYPRQNRTWFEARDARPSLSEAFADRTEAQLVFAGLDALAPEVLGRVYYREGNADELSVERALVDCGWQQSAVFQWIRQSPFANVAYPSKGIARTMTARGVAEWKRRPGERAGWNWRLTVPESGRIRMVQFDPDQWKTRLYGLLTIPPGGPTGLSFWGKSPAAHEMIAAHLAAEYSEPATIRGSTFDKWSLRVEKPDNHLLDCLVGCAVAAGVAGLEWSAREHGEPEQAQPKKKPISFAEIQAARQAAGPVATAGRKRISYAEMMKERSDRR